MNVLRKRLKSYRILRNIYNFIIWIIFYLLEWSRYLLPRLKTYFSNPDKVKEILLIRTFGIGDIIRTTPILPKLKKKYKNSKIYYFTSEVGSYTLQDNPYIDVIYTKEKGLEKVLSKVYDVVINWQIFDNCPAVKEVMRQVSAKQILGRHFINGSYDYDVKLYLRTWLEKFCMIALIPYATKDTKKTKIYISPKRRQKQKELLKKYNIKDNERYIGICLGGDEVREPDHWYRNYSIEFIEKLIKEIYSSYPSDHVILVGLSKERLKNDQLKLNELKYKFPSILYLIDKLNIEELLLIIDRCNCFISSDTGPLHIALAVQTPLIAIFSNNKGNWYISSQKRGKYYSILFNDEIKCFPCEQVFRNECLESKRARCIENIPVDKIIKEVNRFL